ncbi:oxidoreductase family, NAD-binding Rossmann fold [mine drainage metagenome]|uniref:Oxidoreductase family, NAD-binding Rossmann fold n=1 Tax=mine drainage metagenome TaxID=410659 RepID=A0A1J5PPR5_9ZZZZ
MKKVIPAMQKGQWSHVGAIASRSLEAVQKVATTLGISKAYGSYDELLADPEIEAIYNPLPNDQHVAMTLANMCCARSRLP